MKTQLQPIFSTYIPELDVVSYLMLERSWQFATVTLLIYDAMVTLDKETEFFWGKSLKYPIQNRYTGIFGAISRIFMAELNVNSIHRCGYSGWTFNISNILMVRVLALYSRPKSLSICLIAFLVLEAAAKACLSIYLSWEQHVSSVQVAENISACNVNVPNLTVMIIDWSVPMVYGLVLMLLALYKAAEYWRMSAGLKGFKLVEILIRDQMIYFFLAVSCCVLNIMQLYIQPKSNNLASFLEQAGSPSFLCILGSRLFFNMKEAGKLGVNEGTSYRMKSLSNIEFERAAPARNEVSIGFVSTAEDV
ncbi:uncharacterized protein FOMMEDRAFT_160522 [Fomitiporia mediterranea MF3/22]|uniref:uncharacterized protein n=1 Tax=Fomitiporia mediterranea (strain MF3/22) TaxID=694068 RepID=UPI000440802D|nr:uncharacterized protein FOMMEDRAFT_160522 [Fomitiporia mediterranea MF3/22]EJC99467.1 hypothetical protein FOMMEDRAFT_160522 [Fomitiporia mediterranea MF3/22]